ncbi:MAG: nitrite reductase, copper-containing [Candidatus Nitrohelix vancouverensis]|uniref:Copper-containing nitrite reductase n=1 Tax=Candidatus Nitrohelix vancouverensis TaxID=2705534 RepID=A0A7T0C1Y8_9BACT|nr:MAG: nitrite reductase, copper-containing [Candidatus Nitrohelix vancouverensis]
MRGLFNKVTLTLGAFAVAFSAPALTHAGDVAKLTHAPNVPAPITRSAPTTVIAHLEAKEVVGDLSDKVKYSFWTFGGTVPGPMLRARVGDTIEFHLHNHKDNSQDHNIDIHAVNGPGGGAAVNTVKPGGESVFTFKAKAAGLFIYHCAAGQIVDHISNGMYGLVLIEPEGGLPPADKEYYVFESEFYTNGAEGVQGFDINKGLAEHPDFVVFNGRVGGLMGDNVLTAKVGEKVRLYFGNIGPNGISSFHIIGEIFDTVYVEGALGGLKNHGVQTTLIPSAGATIVEFVVDAPGDYTLVDHSIFRVAKGAIGVLEVEGEENPEVFRAGK